MANGFSQYQQSSLGVSAAKARAISERSQAQFRTRLTADQEKAALERAADQLEQIAKEAARNARRRGRRASFGRLLGSAVGFALGGPAGKAALGTALGGLAGTAAAGGFKRYGVDIPDSLVPGGVFYGRGREAFKQRAEDLEEAMKDLTREQREGIAKNLFTDYLSGRGLGKLGKELEPLIEAKAIDNVDYLKNVFRKSINLDYTDDVKNILLETQGFKIDPKTKQAFDALQPRLSTDIMEQVEGLSQLRPDITPKVSSNVLAESLFGAPNVSGQNIQTEPLPKPTAPTGSLRGLVEGTSPTGVTIGDQRFLDFQDTDRLIKNLATGQLTEEYPELLDDDIMRLSTPTTNRNTLFQYMVGPMGTMGGIR
jgi:hypothetical protein|tara:strand:+ start:268 stop:1374 length:1107 start_codon:yes stop_codon:yes gene_type:complete